MSTRSLVEDHIEHLHNAISASEEWADSFKKSPETWKRLIRLEGRLERKFRGYFREFSKRRLIAMIDWEEYGRQVYKMAETQVVVTLDDTKWATEHQVILELMYDDVVLVIATGAAAGEVIYDIPLGVSATNEIVEKAARKYIGNLVTNINKTTRNRIRSSIETSIELGEKHEAAVSRLQKVIKDPRRADLIARTEAVRAYSTGHNEFAVAAGAVSKTWDTIPGACELCLSVLRLNKNATVKIDEGFKNSSGVDVGYPPLHPRDRCGVKYNFD